MLTLLYYGVMCAMLSAVTSALEAAVSDVALPVNEAAALIIDCNTGAYAHWPNLCLYCNFFDYKH